MHFFAVTPDGCRNFSYTIHAVAFVMVVMVALMLDEYYVPPTSAVLRRYIEYA